MQRSESAGEGARRLRHLVANGVTGEPWLRCWAVQFSGHGNAAVAFAVVAAPGQTPTDPTRTNCHPSRSANDPPVDRRSIIPITPEVPTCTEPDCDADAAVVVHVPWAEDRPVCAAHGRALVQQDGVVATPIEDSSEWD